METRYTDEQIASMDNVSPEIAGKYLGLNPQVIRILLQRGKVNFGTAVKLRRYVYHIPGPALVRYKHYGNVGNENEKPKESADS